jgi:hypothetical protein
MTDQTRDMHNKRRVCVHSGETCTETAHIEALTKRVAELQCALEQLLASEDFANDRAHWESELAQGNGHAPQVLAAMTALSNAARGEEI